MSDSDNDRVKELFNTCDLDSSGFIDRSELAAVVDLDEDDLDEVFKQLDKDGDGRISIDEFMENYRKCKCIATQVGHRRGQTNGEEDVSSSPLDASSETLSSPEKRGKQTYRANSFIRAHDTGAKMYRRKKPWKKVLNHGQDHLEEIYTALENSDNPRLLQSLEKFVSATVESVQQKQSENEKLDSALKRASEKNSELARSLEEEMEQQIVALQEKIREEEKKRAEKYIEEAMQAIQAKDREIAVILDKVALLEKTLEEEPNKSSDIVKEIEDKQVENQALNSQLREYQTQLALLRSEVSHLRGEYDDQGNRLIKERSTVLQCVSEQENLTRQLHLLHEANRRLHDTNDDLRSALESKRQSQRHDRSMDTPSPSKLISTPYNYYRRSSNQNPVRNEIIEQQLMSSPATEQRSRTEEDVNEASLMSELVAADEEFRDLSRSFDEDEAYSTMPKSERRQFVKQLQILFDTNKRLSQSNDELRGALSLIRRRASKKRPKRRPMSKISRVSSNHSDYASGPGSETDVPINHRGGENEIPKGTSSPVRAMHRSKDSSVSSTDNSESLRSSDTSGINSSYSVLQNLETELSMYAKRDPDEEYDEDDMEEDELVRLVDMTTGSDSESEHGNNKTVEERVLAAPVSDGYHGNDVTPLPCDAPPERMYKLVLAGDAAVGKSSFILRLCKNKFYSSLNSTLGVDFQMKTVNVDGHVVALQLWDTAGQERFRSIAKSYFRKVDGVLLLYDVTCETSFKDVRNWIESVEEGASRPVPIIICGNKTDLRPEAILKGKRVVTRKQGEGLANEFGAMFIETSAKQGSNVEGACLEMARRLWKLEDQEVKQGGVNLHDASANQHKGKSRCCS